MDTYKYTCGYCGSSYKPRRRRVQKYCSTSCRVNAFKLRNSNSKIVSSENSPILKEKKEGISTTGIANAALGSAANDIITKLLTKQENRPATKGDLDRIISLIKNRYLPILNMNNRVDGTKPFYDVLNKQIVYLNALKL